MNFTSAPLKTRVQD